MHDAQHAESGVDRLAGCPFFAVARPPTAGSSLGLLLPSVGLSCLDLLFWAFLAFCFGPFCSSSSSIIIVVVVVVVVVVVFVVVVVVVLFVCLSVCCLFVVVVVVVVVF